MSAQTNKNSGGARATQGRMALDPLAPVLGQPWKRLVEEGFITELVVKFTSSGVQAQGKPDDRVCKVEGTGLKVGEFSPLGMIKAAADKGNLIPRRQTKNGPSGSVPGTPLPAKTLVKSDFGGTDAELLGRARKVAQACGGQTLVGRVRSSNAFDGKVTTSFSDWWASASAEKRVKALVQPRHMGELSKEDTVRLANLECPFRGTADFVVADDEDEDEEQEAPRSSSPKK